MTNYVDSSEPTEKSTIKKMRLDSENAPNILNQFKFVKILNENPLNKLLIIQAIKKDSENTNAVIIFERTHFTTDETDSYLQVNNPIQINIDNNEYKQLNIYPCRPYNCYPNFFIFLFFIT